MKKALITILLMITMSAGIIFSADIVLSAESIPLTYEVTKDDDRGSILVNFDNLKTAILEYTFYSNDILMSRLDTVNLILEGSEIGTDRTWYSFSLPSETLSFKVWRVVDSEDQIKSLDGDHEYVHGEGTSISDVETRLKTLYILDDLITKEAVYSETAEVWKFNMHFNVIDSEGNQVPIDKIHSLKVEYNVIKSMFFGAWKTNQAITKEIIATETRNAMIWPYIIPQSVINNIQESYHNANDNTIGNEDYDWMVNLGTFSVSRLTGSDVALDKTSVLSISYYYEGVFFEDQVVVDEPYDDEDIIPVIPGTTDPLVSISEWFTDLGSKIQFILMGIVVIIALVFISLVFKGLAAVKTVIVMLYKLIAFFVKAMSFILLGIPKWIINTIVFLVIPRTKRKEQSHVSRYL